MPYVPPMVTIAYPEVPADLVTKLNDLITALNTTSTHLSQSGSRVQTFMGLADGAVKNVASISQGKTTQALVETWYYTTVDGNHSHTGMTGVAGHLSATIKTLEQHIKAVKDGMSAVQTLQESGGRVLSMLSGPLQQQIDNLTNALSNIGLALDAAAKLINSINNGMPSACATGFIPGGYYPTFKNDSFNTNQVNMTGKAGSGSQSAIQAIRSAFKDPSEANAFIELLQAEGVNLNDAASLLKNGATPDEIIQWVGDGVNPSDVAILVDRGAGSADQAASWVQGLNEEQLTELRTRAAQNPKASAENLQQLVDPKLQYDPNPKHAQVRPGVSAEPTNGLRALDNSVTYSSTSPRRVGIDPDTGQIVVLPQTSGDVYHGYVVSWNQLTPQMQNALYNNGLITKQGNIILRDAQGNITGYGINVIKGK